MKLYLHCAYEDFDVDENNEIQVKMVPCWLKKEEEEKEDFGAANLQIIHSVVDLNKLFAIIYLVFLLLFQEILHGQPMISLNCYYCFHTDDAFYHLKIKKKIKAFLWYHHAKDIESEVQKVFKRGRRIKKKRNLDINN
jgi:hypothetical protein